MSVSGDLVVTVNRALAGVRVPHKGPIPIIKGLSGPRGSVLGDTRSNNSRELNPRAPKYFRANSLEISSIVMVSFDKLIRIRGSGHNKFKGICSC